MTGAATLAREGRTPDGRRWRIRPTTRGDAPGIVALQDAVAAEGGLIAALPGERGPAEESLVLAAMLSEGGLSLTLEIDSQLVGHLVCQRRSARWERHVGELAIIVDNLHRGVGLGRQLLLAAIDWARATNLSKLVLAVYPENQPAVQLYASLGFVEEGRQRNQVQVADQMHDLLLMGLVL